MAAFTQQVKIQVYQLLIGMFNASPGIRFFTEFEAFVGAQPEGSDVIRALANQVLAPSSQFQSVYPPNQTNAQFASTLLGFFNLSNEPEALNYINLKLNAGQNRVNIIVDAIKDLANYSGTQQIINNAKAILQNRVEVSQNFTEVRRGDITDVRDAQNKVDGVDATDASKTSKINSFTAAPTAAPTAMPTAAPTPAPTASNIPEPPSVPPVTDTTPPKFASAAVNGTTLVLTYDEDLSAPLPTASAFTVKVNGTALAAGAFTVGAITGKTITLNLNTAVTNGQTVLVSYADPTTGNDVNAIQDAAGNDAVTVADQAVANNTPTPAPTAAPTPTDTTPPKFVSAAVNGTALVLTYDEDLAAPLPTAAAFTVKVNGTALAANAFTVGTITGKTLTLNLNTAVTNGQTVLVTYTDPTTGNDANAIQDAAGNDAVTITDQAVTNNTPAPVDTTPPVFTSAEVNGTALTLTYGEDLSAQGPAAKDFTIKINGVTLANTAYTLGTPSNKTVAITLNTAVTSGSLVTVAYTDPTTGNDANAIQDAAGNDAITITDQAVTNKTAVAAGQTVTPTARSTAASETAVNTNFTDPLFKDQWNLNNTGQRYTDDDQQFVGAQTAAQKIAAARAKNANLPLLDINVMGAWAAGYTGKGIIQSVSDDGFDLSHEDIQNNLLKNLAYNGSTNAKAGAGDYSNTAFFNNNGTKAHQHGTVVGTIAANEANNGKGTVGIAFDSKLIPAAILDTKEPANNATQLKYLRENNVAVSLNSYGADPAFSENYGDYNGNFRTPDGLVASTMNDAQFSNMELGKEIRLAAEQGRNGLGMILEFSAGNERGPAADSALTNGTTSRYVIAVGAMNEVGDVASYGSRGTNILLAAFGGDGNGNQTVNAGFGIIAGDNKAQLNTGYNNVDNQATANIDEASYSFYNTGTSYSGPTVGAVAALMLQANPNLGFRDVSTILALTARKVGDQAKNDYVTNKAMDWNLSGMHFSSEGVGFGLVDATAAVRLAEQWLPASNANTRGTAANWKSAEAASQNPQTAIPDQTPDGAGITVTAVIPKDPNNPDIRVERMEFDIKLTANRPNELKAIIESPSGTKAVIFNRPLSADAVQNPNDPNSKVSGANIKAWPGIFTIGSSAFLGESATGTWKLTIIDTGTNNGPVDMGANMTNATFDSLTVRAWGSSITDDSQYTFTREYTATDKVITDATGVDTINAAAVHGAVTLNLNSGVDNLITNDTATQGKFTIANGSVIENAIGGGSNDTITGNDAANLLKGVWGNDTLSGGLGNDTLVGGQGADSLTGGDGNDVFVITEDLNASTISFFKDTITDFTVGQDKLQFSAFSLTRLANFMGSTAGLNGAAGAQGVDFLVNGKAATGAFAQFIYDKDTGALSLDVNGTAADGVVQVADLVGTIKPAGLNASDFIFVA